MVSSHCCILELCFNSYPVFSYTPDILRKSLSPVLAYQKPLDAIVQ